MEIQIKNKTIAKNNQIRVSKTDVIKAIKTKGWKICDCIFTEIKPALIRGPIQTRDGKTNYTKNQYAGKASELGTLNKK